MAFGVRPGAPTTFSAPLTPGKTSVTLSQLYHYWFALVGLTLSGMALGQILDWLLARFLLDQGGMDPAGMLFAAELTWLAPAVVEAAQTLSLDALVNNNILAPV